MKTPNRWIVLICGLLILLNGCAPAVSSGAQGKIAVSGAFALYPLMVRWAEEYQKVNPGVRIDVSAGGAGKGMADALAGAVEIGMVSRSIKPEEEAKGAFWVAVARDAVFTTLSARNPHLPALQKNGIAQKTLEGIYKTGEIKTWGQVLGDPAITDEIHVYTRSDSAGAAEMWALYTGAEKQEALLGIGINGDPGLLEAVIKDPLGIGYNNLNYAFDLQSGKPVDGAAVLPLDLNQNGLVDDGEALETKAQAVAAVASGRYPSPPARTENLVTQGKPSGAVLAFLQWILADGQKYVEEAGYVPLPADDLKISLEKIR